MGWLSCLVYFTGHLLGNHHTQFNSVTNTSTASVSILYYLDLNYNYSSWLVLLLFLISVLWLIAELVRQMAAISQRDTDRWNFDFVNEKPLDGQYSWELIAPCTEAVTRSSAIKTPESSPTRSDGECDVMSSPEVIARLQPAVESPVEAETALERCTRSAKQNKITGK